MKLISSIAVVTFLLYCCRKPESSIKLNELQVIGSHNSYKKVIEQPILDYIATIDSMESIALEYSHLSFIDQLDLGLRSIEIDVFHDPVGGHYKEPIGLTIVEEANQTPKPFDTSNKLARPGLKVFHIQEIDFRSHQLLFSDALEVVEVWSNRNPNHTPLFITINAKDEEIKETRKPFPFDAEALKTIDSEILEVFSKGDLITPDLVRGSYDNLESAILSEGWPNLEDMRGRIMFILDEVDPKRGRYISLYPGLKSAVLFVNQEAGNPEAGFMIINDPINDFELIRDAVNKGYMVRTRADASTIEARNIDYRRFEKAKESGAQIITTDYYIPSNLFPSTYKVIYDDGSYERLQNLSHIES